MHSERVTPQEARWHPSLSKLQPPGPPAWDAREAAWMISRYADIQSVLRSDDVSSPDASSLVRRVAARVGFDASSLVRVLDGAMVFQNGAAYRSSRDAVMEMMPQLTARWSRERIDDVARQLVIGLATGPAIDVVETFVDALPNAIAADILGISTHDVSWLRECATDIMTVWRPAAPRREYERLERVAREVVRFMRTRLREPSRIALGVADAGAPAVLEFWFATATVATTSGTLGAAIHTLSQLPDLQDVLRTQPDRMPAFIDETLRLTGGARRLSRRIALRPFEIGGALIPEGAAVLLDLERAGRDPVAYPEPETIDLERVAAATLAFGGGQHPCLGPRLARAELICAIQNLLAAFALSPASEPSFLPNPDLRQFATLPLCLERR